MAANVGAVGALARDWVEQRLGSLGVEHLIGPSRVVIVLAEGGRDVHEAGAVLGGDEIAGDDGGIGEVASADGKYRRLVGDAVGFALASLADQVAAGETV